MTSFARPKNKAWSRPLADLVGGIIDPVLARQGFGESGIILNWEEIVGTRIARGCEPVKLQWPPRGAKRSPDTPPEPALLVLRVEGAFAIELQHLAPIVIERVNAHLGWRCIAKLALRQGPLLRSQARGRKELAVDPKALALAAASAAPIADAALRDALTRLGARALAPQ